MALRHYSDLVGKPLHACAAELIERGLGHSEQLDSQQQGEQENASNLEDLPRYNGEFPENSEPVPPEKNEDSSEPSTGQMDFFAE